MSFDLLAAVGGGIVDRGPVPEVVDRLDVPLSNDRQS